MDRSAYSFVNHLEKSSYELTTREMLSKPINVQLLARAPNKEIIGRSVRRNAQATVKNLSDTDKKTVSELQTKMEKVCKDEVTGFHKRMVGNSIRL